MLPKRRLSGSKRVARPAKTATNNKRYETARNTDQSSERPTNRVERSATVWLVSMLQIWTLVWTTGITMPRRNVSPKPASAQMAPRDASFHFTRITTHASRQTRSMGDCATNVVRYILA